MVNHQGMDNIIGKMVVISKVNFLTDYVMVQEYGKRVQDIMINIKANMKMIKKMGMEYLHGLQEMYIKEIINQMLEMDMDKCIGVMEVIIKGNGEVEYKMEMGKYIYQEKDTKKEYFKIMYLL